MTIYEYICNMSNEENFRNELLSEIADKPEIMKRLKISTVNEEKLCYEWAIQQILLYCELFYSLKEGDKILELYEKSDRIENSQKQ